MTAEIIDLLARLKGRVEEDDDCRLSPEHRDLRDDLVEKLVMQVLYHHRSLVDQQLELHQIVHILMEAASCAMVATIEAQTQLIMDLDGSTVPEPDLKLWLVESTCSFIRDSILEQDDA